MTATLHNPTVSQTAEAEAMTLHNPTVPPTGEAEAMTLETVLEVSAAGSKAAMLARLRNAGFAVPRGVVLSAQTTALLLDDSSAAQRSASILQQILRTVGDGPWAVRSSAVSKDTAEASFAGQYQTNLGVSQDDLLDAIRACATSGRGALARAYSERVGAAVEGTIPVLLMSMVDARCAGVAFSADPTTGDDVAIVSAVPGLGDRLVDGTETPDEWAVRRDGTKSIRHRATEALSDDEVAAVAALVWKVEANLGKPVDIEWAIDREGALVLLQARPITALPQPQQHTWGPGVWTKDVAHYPVQMTPFGTSLADAMTHSVVQMAEGWGLVLSQFRQVYVGGEVYTQPVPLGPPPKDGGSSEPPPAFVMGILSRLIPAFRERMRTAQARLSNGDLESAPARWQDQWRPQMQERAAATLRVDPDSLDDQALAAHMTACEAHVKDGSRMHFQLVVPFIVGVHEFVEVCRERFGMGDLEALEVLRGSSSMSSEPALALAVLADKLRANPAAWEVVQTSNVALVERLRPVDASLASEVASWLERYGWRTNNYDAGAPALIEQPAVFAALLRSARTREVSADMPTNPSLDALESRLGCSAPNVRAEVERVLEAARAIYGVREDNAFWCDAIPAGLLRRAVAATGRRLAEKDILAAAQDVSWLMFDEVMGALAGRASQPELRALIRQRRAEYAWQAAHPGPLAIGGTPGSRPDLRYLPRAGRRFNCALMWFLSQEHAEPIHQTDGAQLVGRPGSAGQYRGIVRVVREESDLERLNFGEVLVCPVTTPAWSPAFAVAGALVTDHGGALSHCAIVARENALPAVVGAVGATTRLEDGMDVTVDGSAGTVTIHD